MSCQSRFNAQCWMLGAGALGRPRGMEWGGRREEGSGWGTHVYLWQIHDDIWQNQYNIVKLKNKIKWKEKRVLEWGDQLMQRIKSRDITLQTKVHLVKAMVFLVVMYGCEIWTIKKAEYWRIDAFELWCWRRLLIIPWTARRSNQSILKEISPEYSLERLMLKLKLQYFGHMMQRTDSFENTLMLGKIEGGRRRGWQRMRRLDGTTDSMDMSLSKLRECCSPWGGKEPDTTERLNNNN